MFSVWFNLLYLLFLALRSYSSRFLYKLLEETFAQQLEEQERVYGPVAPLTLPPDLTDLNTDSCSRIGLGSTRSSLSSVSEG